MKMRERGKGASAMPKKGGFWDGIFGGLFGGLFDFDGDGKEDMAEKLIGYQMLFDDPDQADADDRGSGFDADSEEND